MPKGTYYRRQAEICLTLARACARSAIAKRLVALAADFQAKAGTFKDDARAAKPARVSSNFPSAIRSASDRLRPFHSARRHAPVAAAPLASPADHDCLSARPINRSMDAAHAPRALPNVHISLKARSTNRPRAAPASEPHSNTRRDP